MNGDLLMLGMFALYLQEADVGITSLLPNILFNPEIQKADISARPPITFYFLLPISFFPPRSPQHP